MFVRFTSLALLILLRPSHISWAADETVAENAEKLVKEFGSFQLPEAKAREAQEFLQGIANRLRLPTDPEFRVVYVNHPADLIAVGSKADVDPATGRKYTTIVVFHGAIADCPTAGRLKAKFSHEIAHSDSKPDRTDAEVTVQMQREELLTADRGGMERLVKAGEDPRELRNYFIDVQSRKTFDPGLYQVRAWERGIVSAMHSHPPEEFRVTFSEAWLTENEAKHTYPSPSPKTEIMEAIAKSKPAVLKAEPKPAPPPKLAENEAKDVHLREVLSKLKALPQYQGLSAIEKLRVLREVLPLERAYHTLIWHFYGNPETIRQRNEGRQGFDHTNAVTEIDFYLKSIEGRDQDRRSESIRDLDFMSAAHYSDGYSYDDNVRQLHPIQLKSPDAGDAKVILDEIQSLLKENSSRPMKELVLKILEKDYNVLGKHYTKLLPALKALAVDLRDSLTEIPRVRKVRQLEAIQENRKKQKGHVPLTETQYARALRDLLVANPTEENIQDFLRLANKEYSLGTTLARLDNSKAFSALIPKLASEMVRTRHPILFYSGRELFSDTPFQSEWVNTLQNEALEKNHLGLTDKLRVAVLLDGVGISLKETIPKLLPTPESFFRVCTPENAKRMKQLGSAWEQILTSMNTKWTLPQMRKVLQLDPLWPKSEVTAKTLASFGAVAGRMGFDGIEPLVNKLTEQEKDRYSAPTYQYNLHHSEQLQKWAMDQLAASDQVPANAADRMGLFHDLAMRGGTLLTDTLAEEWFLDEKTPTPNEHLASVLDGRLVYDFPTRLKLYRKWRKQSHSDSPPAVGRAEWMDAEIKRIDHCFPESSPARAMAYEDFAGATAASFRETSKIQAQKYREDANIEGMALRAFSGIFAAIKAYRPNEWGDRSSEEVQLAVVKFLLGKGEFPPEFVINLRSYQLTPQRLQKLFEGFPPSLKALILNPFLAKPHGLYNTEYKQNLIRLVVEDLGDYRAQGELLVKGLLHGLNRAAEYQETLALSFLLGQSIRSKSIPQGEKLRIFLESLGGTGVALSQRLYQRRLVSDEFLPYLAHTQDQSRVPDRYDEFLRIMQLMKIEDPDTVVEIVRKLGAGSAKSTLEIKYLDGRLPPDETRALKNLREYLVRTNEIEAEKAGYTLDYLIEHGGPEYRPLISVFKDIKRGLDLQADSTAESRNYPTVARLYHSGEIDAFGVKWHVIEQDPRLGVHTEYSHEQVASGVPLKSLTEEQRRRIFPSIAAREEKILMENLEGPEDGLIQFERDRHLGNFKVDFSGTNPVLFLYDYPLLSTITRRRAKGILELIALSEASRVGDQRIPSKILSEEITRLLLEVLSERPPSVFQHNRVLARLQERLKTPAATDRDPVARTLDLLSIAEKEGISIEATVHDYLAALQNAERYARDSGDSQVTHGHSTRMRARLTDITTRAIREQTTFSARCAAAVRGLVRKLVYPFSRAGGSR